MNPNTEKHINSLEIISAEVGRFTPEEWECIRSVIAYLQRQDEEIAQLLAYAHDITPAVADIPPTKHLVQPSSYTFSVDATSV